MEHARGSSCHKEHVQPSGSKVKSQALDTSTIHCGAACMVSIHFITKPNPKFTPLCIVYFNPSDVLDSTEQNDDIDFIKISQVLDHQALRTQIQSLSFCVLDGKILFGRAAALHVLFTLFTQHGKVYLSAKIIQKTKLELKLKQIRIDTVSI